MDPVHPRHHVPRAAVVDLLILIGIGDARKGELVVDGTRVIAEHVAQRRCDPNVVKRAALSGEERLQFRWKRIADGR